MTVYVENQNSKKLEKAKWKSSLIIVLAPMLFPLWHVKMSFVKIFCWTTILKLSGRYYYLTLFNLVKIMMILFVIWEDLMDYVSLCSLGGATPQMFGLTSWSVAPFDATMCRNSHQHRFLVVKKVELFIDIMILSQYSPLKNLLK